MAHTSAPRVPATAIYVDMNTNRQTTAKAMIREYLLERLPVYRELCDLQKQVRLSYSPLPDYP